MAPKPRSQRKSLRTRSPKARKDYLVRMALFLGLAALVAGAIFLLKRPDLLQHHPQALKAPGPGLDVPPLAVPALPQHTSLTLYFSDPDSDYLREEPRTLRWKQGDVPDQMRVIVEALIKGPESDLVPTIPAEVKLRAVEADAQGKGVVDFSSALSANHPGGSQAEVQTIYSIVNSLVLNIPSLQEVQILVEGKTLETLKGHVDLRNPLKADRSLILTGPDRG